MIGGSRLRRAAQRVYADFLMPDRLGEYRALLQAAVERGYELTSIGAFRRDGGGRQLVLRRDVDTDVRTAAAMFEVERALGARVSYFFRLSTCDVPLMRRVEEHGSEAGYHFEEIATVVKERRLRTRDDVTRRLPEIRERFRVNLLRLREQTGLPLRIVAAHGDWANRRLGIPNQTLLDDALRAELDIEWEAYDADLLPGMWRASDAAYPVFWTPEEPRQALSRGEPVVHLLTHPRHWRRNVPENLREDLHRAWEGLRWR